MTTATEEPTEFGIGVIGAGFAIRELQLVAYRNAGFRVAAIASRTQEHAAAVAEEFEVSRVYSTWNELLDDRDVSVLALAFPPAEQLAIVREACKRDHILGILAQKPLATSLSDAIEMERICRERGTVLSVNQNMRFDRSILFLKQLLDQGRLGRSRHAQIVSNVNCVWPEFVTKGGRVAILNSAIHHLDAFRYLFGDPDAISCSTRPMRTDDGQLVDGGAFYTLEYADGLRCVGCDPCVAYADQNVEWRVEGERGTARGRLGWPDHPVGSPSTIDYWLAEDDDVLQSPRWNERWFPDAFEGTMRQLLEALRTDTEPILSARDNLRTMALVEAAYRSVAQRRWVYLEEVLKEFSIA